MQKMYSYQEIKEKLMNKINSKEYKQNSKIPSERELSEFFEVSRTTVRKAINELVNENYLSKEPGRGTFVNNNQINKIKNKTNNIFFLRFMHNSCAQDNKEFDSQICEDIFYPQVVAGVDYIASQKDYHCIFKYIYEDEIDQNLLNAIKNKADALICGELHNKSILKAVKKLELPVVLISPSVMNNKLDVIDIDNYTGAYDITKYLIELGHEKLAFIGGSQTSNPSIKRKSGFLSALNNFNINFDEQNSIIAGWRLEDGYNAAKSLLERNLDITAIFAVSDLLAIGAINAINDLGLKVPDDISVTGFDDIDLAKQIRPSLTTMRVRKSDLGKEAASLIFEKLDNRERDYAINTSIPCELKVRKSTKKL